MATIFASIGNALFYGVFGWFAIGRMGTQGQARLAGFFLALGFVIGSLGGHAGTEPDQYLMARATGYTVAIVILAILALALRAREHRQR